jgi:hypothetical protein
MVKVKGIELSVLTARKDMAVEVGLFIVNCALDGGNCLWQDV